MLAIVPRFIPLKFTGFPRTKSDHRESHEPSGFSSRCCGI